jgi:hypothetical protein
MPLVSIYREIDLAATIEYPKSISRQRRIQHSANVFLDQHDWQLSAGAKSGLSARRDHAGLELCHRDHLLKQESTCRTFDLWKIRETDVDAGLEQTRQ